MAQQNGTPGYCGDQVSDVDYWAPEPPTYEEYKPPLHKPSNSRASLTPDRAVLQQNNATFSHVEFGSSPLVRAEDSSLKTRYESTNIQRSHKLNQLVCLSREMLHSCWCGRAFKRKFDLKRHHTIHGEGRLQCQFQHCKRRFRRRDNLKEHERRHRVKEDLV